MGATEAPLTADASWAGFDPEACTIEPVRVGALPGFLAACSPLFQTLATLDVAAGFDAATVVLLMARHGEQVIEATAIGAGVPRDWLAAQTPDVLVSLAGRVLEVNADFFVTRLMPAVSRAGERVARLGM